MRVRVLLVVGLMPLVSAPARSADNAPTFNKDVAPILFAHCASCHRTGEVGPFPLLSYTDVKKPGKQIAEVTNRRVMPPWKPVKGHGEFPYDRSLSQEQITVFQEWLDAGMPEGKPADLPPSPKFPEGWHLGPPDMILKVQKPFRIPAVGEDLYVHFVLPTGLKEDKYLRAVQVLLSNKRVAHHGVPILDEANGTASKLAKKNGGHYVQFGGPGFLPRGFLPGYAPGMRIHEGNADQLITLSKGLDVVLQMHYHPIGKEEFDQPQIGLYFTDKKPKRNSSVILMSNNDIDIPAGEKQYKRSDSFTLPVDYEFRSVFAHMHMIGTEVRVWAELPDKTKRDLFLIDDWDFNWQDTYSHAKPFVLPKGTVVKSEFVWNNTSDHPRNPNSPPKRVRLGENSTDEMSGVILGGLPVREADELTHWLTVIGHYFEVERKANEAKKKWENTKK